MRRAGSSSKRPLTELDRLRRENAGFYGMLERWASLAGKVQGGEDRRDATKQAFRDWCSEWAECRRLARCQGAGVTLTVDGAEIQRLRAVLEEIAETSSILETAQLAQRTLEVPE
jgi:hypothetical protein